MSEIVIKHAEAGGEPSSSNTLDYHVQISDDGKNFKDLVEVDGNKRGITEDQVPVTKGRYVRLVVDKPTQGDDNAARIYEFEVMGLEGDVALPPAYEPELNADELNNLVDKETKRGDIDDVASHALSLHLEAVSHYEDKQKVDKVSKHLNGFKQLLDHGLESNLISEEAHKSLMEKTGALIEKWNVKTD